MTPTRDTQKTTEIFFDELLRVNRKYAELGKDVRSLAANNKLLYTRIREF